MQKLPDNSKILLTARLKLARASERLANIEKFIDDRDDLTFYFKHEVGADGIDWAILKFDEMPAECSLLCGEFAHQARSALDVAFNQIARSSGSKVEKLAFPFAVKASHLISDNKTQFRHLAEVPKGIRQVIIEAAPHEEAGGNYDLVSLNKICNLDKHNDIIALIANGINCTGMALDRLNNTEEQFVVALMHGSMAGTAFTRNDKVYSDGFKFAIPDPVLEMCSAQEAVAIAGRGTRLPFNVVFSNTNAVDGRNVEQLCTAMRDEVSKLLDRFDEVLAS